MSTEDKKDKIVEGVSEVVEEAIVVEEIVVEQKPRQKNKSRKRKPKVIPVVLEVESPISIPTKKSTQFKQSEIKIMQGRPRSGIKTKDDKVKSNKDTRITKPSKGFDFS